MEAIINNLKNLFTTYGFEATTIVVSTVILVNIIKRPIVKYGTKIAIISGYDKSIVTKNVSILPFIVAFLLTLIFTLIKLDFKFMLINWSELAAASFIYAGLAVSTYEIGKKQLEAYATKVNNKPPLVDGENTNNVDIDKKISEIEDPYDSVFLHREKENTEKEDIKGEPIL